MLNLFTELYSHRKCHSLPEILEKVHITAKSQKTDIDKYATSANIAFSITTICLIN